MRISRPWLAVVIALFALPLFFGLGHLDLKGDEAAHSFSVDRILEIGDWLAPRSSPSDDTIFLEKPPLKFWIVAAPIKLGLLPHDEFGMRFWDALFGGLLQGVKHLLDLLPALFELLGLVEQALRFKFLPRRGDLGGHEIHVRL